MSDIERDVDLPVEMASLRAQAAAGDAEAAYRLGVWYESETDGESNDAEAYRYYAMAAALGHTEALYEASECRLDGRGTPVDRERAMEGFRLAAERGSPDAAARLGILYAYGMGVAADPAEAERWYRVAAETDGAAYAYELAEAYEMGRGIRVDRKEAIAWYRKAAACGVAGAVERLKTLGE